jgi:hypothetical protein
MDNDQVRIDTQLEVALVLLREARSGYLATRADEDYELTFDERAADAFDKLTEAAAHVRDAQGLVAALRPIDGDREQVITEVLEFIEQPDLDSISGHAHTKAMAASIRRHFGVSEVDHGA